MPFYEVVYETGRSSIMQCEDDAEAQGALKAHHERALAGLPGGPVGAPAERVKAVYVYDKHPNDFNLADTMSADVLQKEVSALIEQLKDENGVVSVGDLSLGVRLLTHPMQEPTEAFGSNFRMESKPMAMSFLEGEKA